MKAVRFTNWKTFPELKDIETPTPGPGEVLLKVAGAGACHSDVAVFSDYDADFPRRAHDAARVHARPRKLRLG